MTIDDTLETMNHWINFEEQNKDKINKVDELIEIQKLILENYNKLSKENEDLKLKNINLTEKLIAERNSVEPKSNFFDYYNKPINETTLKSDYISIKYIKDIIEELRKTCDEYEKKMENDTLGIYEKEFLKTCTKIWCLTDLITNRN